MSNVGDGYDYLREAPDVIESVRKLSEVTGESFDEVMEQQVAEIKEWEAKAEAKAMAERAAAKNPPLLDEPAGPAVRKFRALLR